MLCQREGTANDEDVVDIEFNRLNIAGHAQGDGNDRVGDDDHGGLDDLDDGGASNNGERPTETLDSRRGRARAHIDGVRTHGQSRQRRQPAKATCDTVAVDTDVDHCGVEGIA